MNCLEQTNPVLMLTHNCLEQTKRCVESVRAQDIPTTIYIFDNGSTDDTLGWLQNEEIDYCHYDENKGVSFGWNYGLSLIFEEENQPHAMVINNDIVLSKWTYRRLLDLDELFVTGNPVLTMEEIAVQHPQQLMAPCPHFSAFLIRRQAWDAIGSFDDSLVSYCGDLDYHVRGHRRGISLWNSGIPFFHETSSTMNNAPQKERRHLQLQADADRETFFEKYGVRAGSSEYESLFSPQTFGVDLPLKDK